MDSIFPDTSLVHPVDAQQSDDTQQKDVQYVDNDVAQPKITEIELIAELRRYPLR